MVGNASSKFKKKKKKKKKSLLQVIQFLILVQNRFLLKNAKNST